jgi:hypothetical protein
MHDLDPTTRERLADLRRLLRDAQARSSDRTSAGQHTAIVLLDAACEHAAALAAGHLGLQKIKDVETTMNQLREHVPSWQPQGWKGALELRGQRNQAQHRGTRPDPRDVARWADDAEAFVRSLVRVAFDVELGEVMVADAVDDLDVRRLLGAAEQALDRQDYAEAKYSAVDAFEAARSRWRGARPRSGVPWYDRREQYLPEGVTADLERLREQAEVQPFASDYGEYLWLMNQHRRYARSAPVPVEDALRALAFVTEWVLRWEQFVHRNVNREEYWLASTPPATSGVPGAKPSIRDIDVIVDDEAEYTDPAMVRVVVTFQDLPDEYRQQWAFEVGQAVTSMEQRYGGRGGATCDARGVLQLGLVPEIARPETLREVLEQALLRAEARWEAWCQTERGNEQTAAARLADTRDALATWTGTVLASVDYVRGRRDIVRLRFSSRLSARERYWTLELLRRRFGDHEMAHRIAVEDDWAEIPVPLHDDSVGAIVADVLRERDETDETFAEIRVSLEAFARHAAAQLRGVAVNR